MSFAAKAVQVLGIDHDILKAWRGKYKTAKAAKEIINQKKGGLKAWASELLKDYPTIHNHSAKRGDVILINYNGTEAMGVCLGSEAAVLGGKGLEFIPMRHTIKTWGIGHK